MTLVRLYGHQLGYTSFSQVTRGFARALGATGLFGGFVPLDFMDDEVDYPGSSCPVSVNAGMPSGVAQAKAMGNHQHRWLMLAPNSDRVPEQMLEWMPEVCTALLSPSRWGVQVLRAQFAPSLPVRLVHHGVADEYGMDEERREMRRLEFAHNGIFRVLHLTSTLGERKGTKLLLEAWRQFAEHPGQNNQLRIICRREGLAEMERLASSIPDVWVQAGDGVDYKYMQALYDDTHVVCQPSRAEGFGLVPLEAKACGLPVVMTDCTGHADHFGVGASVVVETGDPAPIDDMDGAQAPSLTKRAIYEALCHARSEYLSLDTVARDQAPLVQKLWSWTNTTGRAMKELVDDRENL